MKLEDAFELALQHESGHDRPRDEYMPECMRCHATMESFGVDAEPAAFCVDCMWPVADDLARALLLCKPVIEAAEAVVGERQSRINHARETTAMCRLAKVLRSTSGGG